MKKTKFIHKYYAKDLAQVINDFMLSLQSPEGENFKAVHFLEDTVMIKIANQTFIITITEKDRLS
jgi:hypothetical protein